MIGVIPRADQRQVVEEFFELFKTPWEFYQDGRHYDVVIATVDHEAAIDARLLVLCGCNIPETDRAIGLIAGRHRVGAAMRWNGASVPVYGSLLTFDKGSAGAVHATADGEIAAVRLERSSAAVVRVGYDLFDEVRHLLTVGQPVEHAGTPTLDVHVRMLRTWILEAGVPLLEIPPTPFGYEFTVCLTHDIDFIGIRRHLFDRTMCGFLYRSTVGAFLRLLGGRLALPRVMKIWRAVASLPFVMLGWAGDFWNPFPWYLQVESGLPATYFLIPFKRRAGERVPGRHAARRATAYDVTDIAGWARTLVCHGCEVGVHGIDAWHDERKGRAELTRIASVTGTAALGIRMHWLLNDAETPSTLERAGYVYDTTAGYNETLGYRNGTSQVFRPLTTHALFELPLHIQDGALFYPHNLDLSDAEADRACRRLIEHARTSGGALTLLWHDRSHGPERYWGEFYSALVKSLRASNAWFATASQAVDWFRARRRVRFARLDEGRGADVRVFYDGTPIDPPVIVRRHRRTRASDTAWNGASSIDVTASLPVAS